MNTPRLVGFAFVALASVLFSIDRIAAQYDWVIQKAAVAIHGSGSNSGLPDLSGAYRNPATLLCLVIGILLIALGRGTPTKNA